MTIRLRLPETQKCSLLPAALVLLSNRIPGLERTAGETGEGQPGPDPFDQLSGESETGPPLPALQTRVDPAASP